MRSDSDVQLELGSQVFVQNPLQRAATVFSETRADLMKLAI